MKTKPRKEKFRGNGGERLFPFAILGALLGVLLALNLFTGSAGLSPGEVLALLLRPAGGKDLSAIVWEIRLPRLLTAALLGGALALSGLLLQTYFDNPIAGPFVLGVSAGAKLAMALALIVSTALGLRLRSAALVLSAFTGSLAAIGTVLLLSRNVRGPALLIVCGVMTGYLCSAATDIAVTFAADADIVNLHSWAMGSFAGMDWDDVKTTAVISLGGLLWALFLSKPMGAWQLGENYARSMGVPVRRFQRELILLSSLLSACVTAYAGPISFVGVAVPHLVKRLFRTARPLITVPACFLGGAVFCLLCELLARSLFQPTELSVSSVTAVFGAPVALRMLLGRTREREAFL